MNSESKRIKTLQNLGIVTLALVSLYYINILFERQIDVALAAINSILIPFGIALFISYLLAPIVNVIESKFRIKYRLVTIFIVFLLVVLVAIIFVFFIGRIIYFQGTSFFENDLDNIVVWVQTTIENNPYLQETYDDISKYITFENASPFIFNVVNIVRSIGSFTVIIVLIPVFLFFLLRDKQGIFEGIVSVVPKKYKPHINELGQRANIAIQKYFGGRFLSMFIMSILNTIMFLVLGFNIQYSLFFGFMLGFLDIVPYIGPFIGLLIPILYSFTIQGNLLLGFWTFAGIIGVNAVLQGIQGNILQPYIMGKEVNLHPLLVLTSFIFFGALFGIVGVILAIPITGTIKTTVEYFNELKEEDGKPKTTKVTNKKPIKKVESK